MATDQKDMDIFQLLKDLKDANGTYPQDLLAPRRQMYLKQVAQIAGGAGLAGALKNTAKTGGKTTGLPPMTGTLLESLLVVAIVAEAGAVSYFYRDKLREAFRSITNSPRVEESSNPPVLSSPIPGLEITLTPVPSETEAITETAIPDATPSLLAGQPTNQAGHQSSGNSTQAISTPAASNDDENKDKGNKYGHTPIPQRTKEPGNDNHDKQPDPKKPHK